MKTTLQHRVGLGFSHCYSSKISDKSKLKNMFLKLREKGRIRFQEIHE